MDEPTMLRSNRHWKWAVWTLRVGYVALATAIVGLVVMIAGASPLVLAVGVCTWLVCVAIILINFLLARHELGAERPRLWSLRMMLVKDTVPTRSKVHD
jgi:hypothetical protein